MLAQHQKRESEWRSFAETRGRRYAECRLSTFATSSAAQRQVVDALQQYASEMAVQVAEGCGVVLYGPPGTGKDHLLVGLAHRAIVQHGLSVVWKNGMDLFSEIRDRIDGEKSEDELRRRFTHPDVLYLSDPLPPLGSLTQFQAVKVFELIDSRYRAQKPTWLTINVANGQEAAERLSVQTYERMKDRALALFCNWPSYRKAK